MSLLAQARISPLALPDFRRLCLSRLASVLALTMVPTALAFAVLERDDAASTLGSLLAARGVAQVVFLLLGGVLADRWPRRALMMSAETAAAAAQLGVAVVFLIGADPFGVLLGLNVLGGAASALFMPAAAGIVPTLVPEDRLHAANSVLRLGESVGAVVGAILAGVVTEWASAGWALAGTAALSLASATLLAGIGSRPLPPANGSSLLQDLRGGFHEFASRQWVWVVVAQFSVLNACFSGLTRVLGPLIALRIYSGAISWSWALTAQTVGLLLGGFVVLKVRPARPLRLATILTFAFVPPLLLLAAEAPLPLLLVAMLAAGMAGTIFEVLWATALQQQVPPQALSRISSYDVLGSVALTPLALAVAGPAGDGLGTSTTLITGAALMAAVTVAALASPSVRGLPSR